MAKSKKGLVAVPVVAGALLVAGYFLYPGADAPDKNGDQAGVTGQPSVTITGEGMTDQEQGDGGEGNEKMHFVVTVVDNVYYYEDEEIAFDELIAMLEECESEVLVEIKDEEAAANAYNNLTDKLTELEIEYIEE